MQILLYLFLTLFTNSLAYTEYYIRVGNINSLINSNNNSNSSNNSTSSYQQYQLLNCNNTILQFVKIHSAEGDYGYSMNHSTFFKMTKNLDPRKHNIYCIIRTYVSGIDYINSTLSRIDGVYNLGNHVVRGFRNMMFGRVVVCRQQRKMSFFEQATTFWKPNMCFKTVTLYSPSLF